MFNCYVCWVYRVCGFCLRIVMLFLDVVLIGFLFGYACDIDVLFGVIVLVSGFDGCFGVYCCLLVCFE